MGACTLGHQAKAVVEQDATNTRALLDKGLKHVKGNLIEQHRDNKMVSEIVKMLLQFAHSTLANNSGNTGAFIGFAFMGLHILDGFEKDGVIYPKKIGAALHNLTEPEELSLRQLDDNFLSCANKFEEIDGHSRRGAAQHEDAAAREEDDEAGAAIGEDGAGAPDADGRGDTSAPKYKELQKTMLDVLEPLCDMVDGLLNPRVEGRFLKLMKDKKTGKGPGYIEHLKNKLGIVTTIVKVFKPQPEDKGLQLLAVMGPESYGKSTLINHILHRGHNKDFMPVTAGMGTQVICKIAEGPVETLQRAQDEFPRPGDVKQMVEKLNLDLSRRRAERERIRETLGIKEMEMLRATVRFEPPYPVEFLDVPGTKEQTLFHTRVALGLATALVLVSGSVDDLKAQLESGDLCLLKDAVKGMNQPIRIQCVASFKISEQEFTSTKHLITRLLKDSFPTCKDLIQEPLFMNFFKARDDAHRQAMVDQFYNAMAAAETQVMNPLKRFMAVKKDVEDFTGNLHIFFSEELKDFLETKIRSPEGAVIAMRATIKAYNRDMPKDLNDSFSPDNIKRSLDDVQVGRLAVFQNFAADKTEEEVNNVALYVQWYLNQCRVHHMGWLKDCSQEFHDKSFGRAFAPLRALSRVAYAKSFNGRLCGTFKFCNQRPGSGDRKSISWWTQKYTSHIAPYLDATALGCLLTGFHLVSTDTRNKVDFLKLLMPKKKLKDVDALNASDTSAREKIIEGLEEVKYAEWVQKYKDAGEREDAFEELFKAIEAACKQFEVIALKTGFLNSSRDNVAMETLVGVAFVLMEWMFVEIKEESEGDHEYTMFAEHLRKGTANADVRRNRLIIEGEDRELAASACCEALRLMQNTSVSATWSAKFQNGILQDDIAKIQMLRDMQFPKFTEGQDRAILLIPQDFRTVITQRGATQGQAYPIASASLAVLDDKIPDRAGAKPSKEFAPYALREIQRVGARVAIFMRRGDTASYDPLPQESTIMAKLQGEPNLVTLFVLWTPKTEGMEWNTPQRIQNWKGSNSSESWLDVRLTPMNEGSFNCEQFVKRDVAKAIQDAAATAQVNLGQIRAKERESLDRFASEVGKYEREFMLTRIADPGRLHRRMVEKQRPALQTKMRKFRDTAVKFDIPPWEFNRQFEAKTLDAATQESATDAAGDGSPTQTEGTTVNELQCRSLHFQVLLGQCVRMCSNLAERVFEEVVAEILNEIAEEEFFMTGSQIISELDVFCLKYKGKEQFQGEIDRLQLLKLLITKQSFQHMYVGCVNYMLIPALYATVLPRLLKGMPGEEEPSDANYKDHMQFAKKMLQDTASRAPHKHKTS